MSISREALVLMSGGIDSAACAHFLTKQGMAVRGIFIDFGQAAARPERRSVKALSAHLGVPLAAYRVCGAVPYSTGELLGRNAFLIFAALFLTRRRSGLIAIGVHTGTPYYDCSPPFIEAMARLTAEHTDGGVAVVAPFLNWSKGDVLHYFLTTGLPIGLTYSCEVGTEPPCQECASCRDRSVLGC